MADDLDFKEQPIEKHIERAKFLGINYFVIISPWIKEKLSGFGLSETKFGAWSIFEITRNPVSDSQNLVYKPALVVSDFSLKARKSDDFSFLRLAEEQFNEAWFDVLLVHNSRNNKIDELTDLENFGAVMIEKYDYDNENKAFYTLKTYSQKNLVILFDSESDLLKRIKIAAAEFGNLKIIDYPTEKESHQLENEFSTYHYDLSEIRSLWKQIKENLENFRIKADGVNFIQVKQTFHPNWQTSNIGYLSTPIFSVISGSENQIRGFNRNYVEIFALVFTAVSMFFCLMMIFKRL